MSDDIVLIKLSSGEELITKYNDGGQGAIFLDDPFEIVKFRDESGQIKVAMMPFMPYAKSGSIVLSMGSFIMARPNDEFEMNYREISSGLTLPKSSIIQ